MPTARPSKIGTTRATTAGATKRKRPKSASARASAQVAPKGMSFKKKVFLMVFLSSLAAVITIVFRDDIAVLGSWGYLGAFAISLISSATIFLPAPGGAAVVLMGRDFNPYLLGAASGVGFALGSLTAYYVGMQATDTFATNRFLRWAGNAMLRFGPPIIFLFNLIPVPDRRRDKIPTHQVSVGCDDGQHGQDDRPYHVSVHVLDPGGRLDQ